MEEIITAEERPRIGLHAEEITDVVIGAVIEVHRELGPGLLESIYEDCMCQELRNRGVPFQAQLELPVIYKGNRLDSNYRIDLLVADTVVVELKAVDRVLGVHQVQLLTNMKLLKKRVGLLINFNVAMLRDGIVRRIL